MSKPRDLAEFPRADADRCVLCGLCLPYCPTYRKTADENESPRGRISLMRAAADGYVPTNARLAAHLSSCLACRACEAMCPSGVAYGRLIDAGRALVAARVRIPWRTRLLRHIGLDGLVAYPPRLVAIARMLRLYQRSGAQWFLRTTGIVRLLGLARLDAALPRLPAPQRLAPFNAAHGIRRGAVALFTGCVARVADAQTLHDAVHVISQMGFDVHVPPAQTCCGALHLHEGEPDQAYRLMASNLRAFTTEHMDAIVTTASGCGAMLAEYAQHLPEEPSASAFAAKITDINRFLANTPWPETLRLAPLPKTIAVQDPCSLRNVQRGAEEVYRVLDRIPGANVVRLAENHLCCGGAGVYPLAHPAMAAGLRADKLAHLRQLHADILATANIGCALHLAAGLLATESPLAVVHPVSLVARQLRSE